MLSLVSHQVRSEDEANPFASFTNDDQFWNMIENEDYNASQDSQSGLSTNKAIIPPETIVTFLTQKPINLQELLQEDFYLHTNSLNKRSLLDLPTFEPAACLYPSCWTLSTYLFWNQMDRNHFTKKSTHLDQYLGFNKDSLLQRLRERQEILGDTDDFKDIISIDIPKLASLFATMSIQERRLGFMFQLRRQWEDIRIRFLIPCYYHEKNYFLCNSLKNEAERVINEQFGPIETSECEEKEFQKRYLISDRFGFGDMRIELFRPLVCKEHYTLMGGIQVTLPTAFIIQNSLKGHIFCQKSSLPQFSFSEFADILTEDGSVSKKHADLQTILGPLLRGGLDRLSANLLEVPLGNYNHAGIGLLIRSETCMSRVLELFPQMQRLFFWLSCMYWKSRMSLEYITPCQERRFFLIKKCPSAFIDRDYTDADQADNNLKFLEESLIEKFYPIALPITVHPGIIFHTTSKLFYTGSCWDFFLGTDTWVQTKEYLSDPEVCPKYIGLLDYKKSDSFFAYQGRVATGCVYHLERPDRTWHFSLNLDSAITSSGIGKDYTVAVMVEANF